MPRKFLLWRGGAIVLLFAILFSGCGLIPDPPPDPTLAVVLTPTPTSTPRPLPTITPTITVLTPTPSAPPAGLPMPGPLMNQRSGVDLFIPEPGKIDPGAFEKTAQEISSAGFTLVRLDLIWYEIETAPGHYDFSVYDRLLAGINKARLRPILTIGYANILYDNGMAPVSPQAVQAFTAFAAASGAHFAPFKPLWELWNEPDADYYWTPSPDAAAYTVLASSVVPALRHADPSAPIVGPGLSGFNWDYLEQLGQSGTLALFDAVSLHPLREDLPETIGADLLRLRSLIQRFHPEKTLPVIFTRWGYSTTWKDMNENRQAEYLARTWLSAFENDVALVIWRGWQDEGDNPGYPNFNLGLIDSQARRKPAFETAAALLKILGGSRPLRRLPVRASGDHAVIFLGEKQPLLVLWTEKRGHYFPAVLPCTQMEGFDLEGKKTIQRGSPKSGFNLPLANLPVFYSLCENPDSEGFISWHPDSGTIFIPLGGQSSIPVHLTAPSESALSGRLELNLADQVLGSLTVTVSAGQEKTIDLPFTHTGWSDEFSPAELRFIPSSGIPQPASLWLGLSDPLDLAVLPALPGGLPVLVDDGFNRSGKFGFQIFANGKPLSKQEIRLPLQNPNQPIIFPLAAPITNSTRLSFQLQDSNGRTLINAAPSLWTWVDPLFNKGNWKASMEGPVKSPSSASASLAEAPDPPLPGLERALLISHRTGIGWRSVLLSPPIQLALAPGKPRAVGFWLYSNTSGARIGSRFRDASGQKFVVSNIRVNWRGWKFVRLPLTGQSASHVGGVGDGNVYYPIQWESILTLDLPTVPGGGERSTFFVTGFAYQY